MIRIQKHNAHGLQLIVRMEPAEALHLIEKLTQAVKSNMYNRLAQDFHLDSRFEDDNDRWEDCSFDIVVEP